MANTGSITWRIIGAAQTAEGGVPTYTVGYTGTPITEPVTIQLDPIFPGGLGAANPEGGGGANPADYNGSFASAVAAAIAALPPGSGVAFNAATYELTFSPGGATSLTFSIAIADDAAPEGPESYLVRIQNQSFGVVETGGEGVVTSIADNDGFAAGQRLWSITGDYAAVEGGQPPKFTVTLGGEPLAQGQTVSVVVSPQFQSGLNLASAGDFAQAFATSVQTAVAALPPGSGVSYDAGTDRLTFTGGGLTSVEFSLPTLADGVFEGDEIYLVAISGASAGSAVAENAESVFSIIVDKEGVPPEVEWLVAGTQLVAEGGVATYTVKWKGPALDSGETVSIELGAELPGDTMGAAAGDFTAAFASNVLAAVSALPPGTGITFDTATMRLVFSAGAPQEFVFSLPTVDDAVSEGVEAYAVTLANPSEGRIIETLGGIVTRITDNDAPPSVAIGNAEAAEGQPLVFDITLSGASSAPVTLELAAANGTATGGTDFETAGFEVSTDGGATWANAGGPNGREVTFAAGATALKVRIDTADDATHEGNETMTLAVASVKAGTVGNGSDTGTGTILESDPPPSVSIGNAQATEGQPLVFDVALSNPSSGPITLQLAATGGTAAAGTDFETASFQVSTDGGTSWVDAGGATGREVTFAAGATALKVRVDTTDDTVSEGDETMSLSVSSVVAGTIGSTADTGTGTILDGDPPPAVTIGNAEAPEGQPLVFDVTLSNPSAGPITLELAATSGTAAAGTDFETASFQVSTDAGTTWVDAGGATGRDVTFAAGETALKVRVDTVDDAVFEGTEAMSLAVSSVVAGTVGDTSDTGTGTILENDAAPAVTIGDATAAEGQPLVFDVTLSGASAGPITLELAAGNATAEGGTDFETAAFQVSTDGGATWVDAGGATGREVTFAAGQTALKVRVDTIDDGDTESAETMTLSVSSVVAGTVGNSADTGQGTITDNDEGTCRLLINEIGLGVATTPSGEGCASYIEIINAGSGACSANELACHRLKIEGPCGSDSVVKFGSFHPAVTLPAGAFLVVYENGEFKTVGADGALLAKGTWDCDGGDWNLGSTVTDEVAVNLFVKSGESVDAFVANGIDPWGFRGAEFAELDAPRGAAKVLHRAGVDRELIDHDGFNGQLGDPRALMESLGLERSLERWALKGAKPLKVFARVFGPGDGIDPDTNSAADWTASGAPTDGRLNALAGVVNPRDGADDLDPRQGSGANAANAGQTMLDAATAGVVLTGGRGADFLYGDQRDNVIDGGDHNDLAFGGDGNDRIRGGAGADLLVDLNGRDLIVGGSGDDMILAAPEDGHGPKTTGGDVLIGDSVAAAGDPAPPAGRDVIIGGELVDIVFGDSLMLDPADAGAIDLPPDQLAAFLAAKLATPGGAEYDAALHDLQHAAGATDQIETRGGNDIVFGQGGDDVIKSGNGDDIVYGGDGNDEIHGEGGKDVLVGGTGADILKGGAGDDVIHANPLEDTVHGGAGKDTLALTMGGVLDLAGSKIQGIEQIDLRGGADLALKISVDDIVSMSGSGKLTVLGQGGDHLTLDASGHDVSTHTSGGFVVHVIDNGAAVLKISADLQHNVVGI